MIPRGGTVHTVASSKADQCMSPKISDGRRCMLRATHSVAGDCAPVPLRYCRGHGAEQARLLRSSLVVIA